MAETKHKVVGFVHQGQVVVLLNSEARAEGRFSYLPSIIILVCQIVVSL